MGRRTDEHVKRFYSERGGAKMLIEPCHSELVKRFFKEEWLTLSSIIRPEGRYRSLIEVGCGPGRYMARAADHGLFYQGLDLVPWLVRKGQRSLVAKIYSEQCRLDAVSISNIHTVIAQGKGRLDPKSALAFFPFNCFGNLAQPERSLAVLARFGLDLFISSFKPDSFSTVRRMEYYGQCGYTRLTHEARACGSLVRSREGLNSYAYKPSYMDAMMKAFGYRRPRRFGLDQLGIGYHFVHSSRPVRADKDGDHGQEKRG